ncbi:serine/threonine-protein kinase HT1-like protein, partial [Tanacetum coccineum]
MPCFYISCSKRCPLLVVYHLGRSSSSITRSNTSSLGTVKIVCPDHESGFRVIVSYDDESYAQITFKALDQKQCYDLGGVLCYWYVLEDPQELFLERSTQVFETEFEKVPRLFNGAVATYPYTVLVTRVDCAIKGGLKEWATCVAGESKKNGSGYLSYMIVIQTYPKNCEYVVISGAQKKYEDFDNEDTETMALPNAKPSSPSSCPSAFRQLISRCWSGKPERRPGFDEIVSILERYAERVEEDPDLLKS